MIFIRFLLISLIVYLIIRSFVRPRGHERPVQHGPDQDKGSKNNTKGVSKEVGEYIDYEEVDD